MSENKRCPICDEQFVDGDLLRPRRNAPGPCHALCLGGIEDRDRKRGELIIDDLPTFIFEAPPMTTPHQPQPHTDGWIEHDGGSVQASKLDFVQVRFRDHDRVKDDFISDTGRVAYWTWWHDGSGDDIVQYRVITNPQSTTQSQIGEIDR